MPQALECTPSAQSHGMYIKCLKYRGVHQTPKVSECTPSAPNIKRCMPFKLLSLAFPTCQSQPSCGASVDCKRRDGFDRQAMQNYTVTYVTSGLNEFLYGHSSPRHHTMATADWTGFTTPPHNTVATTDCIGFKTPPHNTVATANCTGFKIPSHNTVVTADCTGFKTPPHNTMATADYTGLKTPPHNTMATADCTGFKTPPHNTVTIADCTGFKTPPHNNMATALASRHHHATLWRSQTRRPTTLASVTGTHHYGYRGLHCIQPPQRQGRLTAGCSNKLIPHCAGFSLISTKLVRVCKSC